MKIAIIISLLVLTIGIPSAFAQVSDVRPVFISEDRRALFIHFLNSDDLTPQGINEVTGFSFKLFNGTDVPIDMIETESDYIKFTKPPGQKFNDNEFEIIYDPQSGNLLDGNGDDIQGFKIIKTVQPDPIFKIIFPYPPLYADLKPINLQETPTKIKIEFDGELIATVIKDKPDGFTVRLTNGTILDINYMNVSDSNVILDMNFSTIFLERLQYEIIYDPDFGKLKEGPSEKPINGFKIFRYPEEAPGGFVLEITYPYPPDDHNDHLHDHDNDDDKKSGSGGCSDCTPPTIGLDKEGTRLVHNGLVLNGEAFEVDYFKTHMPMQYTEIGKENHLQVKVYENQGAYNIKMVQFAMGVKEIGTPISESQALLEIEVENFSNDIENSSISETNLIDKDELIRDYTVDSSLVQCMPGFNHECLQLDIYWTYDKVTEKTVLALNGWDTKRNSFTDYFNDGLTVIDPNPVILDEVIEQPARECKISKVPTRNNSCQFLPMIENEIIKAINVLKYY